MRRAVFAKIGLFDEAFRIGQYEDGDFFRRAVRAGFQLGSTGACFLHHFGSITQTEMKRERGLTDKQGLSDRHAYRLLNQSWLQRKLEKRKKIANLKSWRAQELTVFGMTLHGVREDGKFKWL